MSLDDSNDELSVEIYGAKPGLARFREIAEGMDVTIEYNEIEDIAVVVGDDLWKFLSVVDPDHWDTPGEA